MAHARYQQKCAICKKNMVQMFSTRQFPICSACQMKGLEEPITDPTFKKLFDIPTELYQQSYFLRSIKENYIRFGSLTEKQIEAFKKAVKDMKEGKKEEKVAHSEVPAAPADTPIRSSRPPKK